MPRYIVPQLMIAIALAFLLACNRSETVNPNVDLTESERGRMITSADRAAQSLGYKPETMNIMLAKEGDIYTVYYLLKGKRALGGGLIVYLNKNGEVIKYLHAP